GLHHVTPDSYRQFEPGFLVPGNGRDLQAALGAGIKNRAAKLDANRDLSVRQAVEVLGGGYVEIESAGHRKIDQRSSLERRDDQIGMRPQKISQGLAPAAGLAKQIEQVLLIFGRVFAAGDLKLNLTAQRNRVNCLFRIGVGQAKL